MGFSDRLISHWNSELEKEKHPGFAVILYNCSVSIRFLKLRRRPLPAKHVFLHSQVAPRVYFCCGFFSKHLFTPKSRLHRLLTELLLLQSSPSTPQHFFSRSTKQVHIAALGLFIKLHHFQPNMWHGAVSFSSTHKHSLEKCARYTPSVGSVRQLKTNKIKTTSVALQREWQLSVCRPWWSIQLHVSGLDFVPTGQKRSSASGKLTFSPAGISILPSKSPRHRWASCLCFYLILFIYFIHFF